MKIFYIFIYLLIFVLFVLIELDIRLKNLKKKLISETPNILVILDQSDRIIDYS